MYRCTCTKCKILGFLEHACAVRTSVNSIRRVKVNDWSLSVRSRIARIINLDEREPTLRRSVADAIFIRFKTTFFFICQIALRHGLGEAGYY
jgi:hypothetical protein